MRLPSIEIRQDSVADVVVVPARSLGHLIKRHRHLTSSAPHDHCYTLPAGQLPALLAAEGMGYTPRDPSSWAIVLADPATREVKHLGAEVRRREQRLAFHAAVHVAFELLAADGRLDEATLRARVRDLGRAEFEEIRRILARDERLFRPDDDREVYIEFAATYLELSAFAPELVPSAFPGLTRLDRVDALLAADIDVAQLAAACGVLDAPVSERMPEASMRFSVPSPADGRQRLLEGFWQRRERAAARRAARAQRYAKSAVLAARLARSAEPDLRTEAEQLLTVSVERFSRTLALPDVAVGPGSVSSWAQTLRLLAERAGAARASRANPEAKLLQMLERTARLQAWPAYLIRITLRRRPRGKRTVVRRADMLRLVQVTRLLSAVAERAESLRLPPASGSVVLPTLRKVSERSREQASRALRAKLRAALHRAGLRAYSGLERVACDRLIDELVDRILARGFVSLPQLRDAISRNDLKLPDAGGGRRDPLLVMDALLSRTLMGVYRRGDVYLRALQKASSFQFGTAVGRVLFLFALLPLAGAFMLLEGARLLSNPVLHWLGLAELPAPGPVSVAVVALVVLGLLHSPLMRKIGRELLEFAGVVVAWIVFRIPHALFTSAWFRRWLSRPFTRWMLRHLVTPAAVAAVAFMVTPFEAPDLGLRLASAAIGFGAASWFMASRVGFWLEGLVVDQLAPTWKVLGQRWLPELLRLVGRFFAALIDGLDRVMAAVDDALRARQRPAGAALTSLTLLTLAWGALAYLVRFYVTLLVEPELNPLKHFPVVTVAHKLMLPFLPTLLDWANKPFSVLGPLLGGALAGLTVFLLPSVFGFLGWELKENYRLYRATRSRHVGPARFGPEGETLRELLVPGLHSGTLPKHYERLRRAAQQHDERRQRFRAKRQPAPLFSHDPELQRFRRKLAQVRTSVRRFVERELLPSITMHPSWNAGSLSVAGVELSSNRVRVSVASPSHPTRELELSFEQLGGHIVATCSRPGFLVLLDATHARVVDNALAVFYHRAGVEVVREQVTRELGRADYDVIGDDIVLYGEAGEVQLAYPISVRWPRLLTPRVMGVSPTTSAPPLDARRFLFAHQPIAWEAWESSWSAPSGPTPEPPRLIAGPSLLPGAKE